MQGLDCPGKVAKAEEKAMEIPESSLLLWESPVSLKGSHPFPVWTPPRQPVLLLESWLLRYASTPHTAPASINSPPWVLPMLRGRPERQLQLQGVPVPPVPALGPQALVINIPPKIGTQTRLVQV